MNRQDDKQRKLAAIWEAIRGIPEGKVCSYGGVARRAGLPGRARYVGYALKHAPEDLELPWFRVITASGRLAFPSGSENWQRQRDLLAAEDVHLVNGRVAKRFWMQPESLDEYLWKPD